MCNMNIRKDTILTGLRSNETLTLGNYLGAILPMIEMQKKYANTHNVNMFVPDLHSFTTPIDHSIFYDMTFGNIKMYVASGLDLDNSNVSVYRQSRISAHSELAWILSCFTYTGEMERMTQYKEKSSDLKGSVTMGLMSYPILMAADILLYNAKYVPVGEDQFQHLEIARDIAKRFNNKFGDVFVVPDETSKQTSFIQRDRGLRIKSLTNPEKKMSKSSLDQKSKINMDDTPEVARKKIMSATTDSIGVVNFDRKNQAGVSNLLEILAYMTGTPQSEVNAKWAGHTRYGDLKKAVADVVCDFLEKYHTAYQQVDDNILIQKLEENEQKMREVANATLLRAQKAVGLR